MEGFAAMYMERGKKAAVLELVEDGTITIEKGAQVLNITASELQSMLNDVFLASK